MVFIKILEVNMVLIVNIKQDQKRKGYVDLPILLSKIYINNTVQPSSKELVSNVKQLVKNLYNNKQITKQVYNNLIKAITYK